MTSTRRKVDPQRKENDMPYPYPYEELVQVAESVYEAAREKITAEAITLYVLENLGANPEEADRLLREARRVYTQNDPA